MQMPMESQSTKFCRTRKVTFSDKSVCCSNKKRWRTFEFSMPYVRTPRSCVCKKKRRRLQKASDGQAAGDGARRLDPMRGTVPLMLEAMGVLAAQADGERIA